MKRILPLLLVVLLLTSVFSVTVSAESSYILTGEYGRFVSDTVIPSGYYRLKLYDSTSDFLVGYAVDPVCFSDDAISAYIPSGNLYFWGAELGYCPMIYSVKAYSDDISEPMSFSFCYDDENGYGECFAADGFYLVLEPVADDVLASGFSNIVSFDTMSSIFSVLFDLVIGNPLLSALCASSLILVCIPIYTRTKSSLR